MTMPTTTPEVQDHSTFQLVGRGRPRGRSSNRVSPDTATRVTGPRYFTAEFFTPGEDCEYDTHPAMCAVEINADSNSRRTKPVHFELVEHQEKPSWRLPRTGKPFLLEPAYFHRCVAARAAARQKAIDLAGVVDSLHGNACRQWRTDTTALRDDRRTPILWVTTTTGLKYDCYSALGTDHDEYKPVMDVDYKYMRNVMDMHLGVGCRDPEYEHVWLYSEVMGALESTLNESVPVCGTVREPYNAFADLRGAIPQTALERIAKTISSRSRAQVYP